MFERFTDRARRVVVLAQEEAKSLSHNYIGTEHILLGLLREEEGVAARALASLSVSHEEVRQRVERVIGVGTEEPGAHVPFTPRAKKVLELALREALALGHDYIGTEHILLGLTREGEGVAAQVLGELDADAKRTRKAVLDLLEGYVAHAEEPPAAAEAEPIPEVSEEDYPTCPACGAVLRDTLAVKALEIADEQGERRLQLAYCGRCGSALGVVP